MGKKVSVIRLALCAALACAASPLLHAASTLDKITKTGIVTLGYREASPPFSYVDSNKRPIGYSLDICLKVVDALKRELKRPDLIVKYAPMLSASRMAELIDGDIDMECGSTTSTKDRLKQVAFTIPTFIDVGRLLVREGSGIKSVYDLSGKTVVTTKGTSFEKLFAELNQSRTLRASLVLAKDHTEAFAMVESGKADAFIMKDVILAGLRGGTKNPEKYLITKDTLDIQPTAIMLRKDDPGFKKVVDSEVLRLINQGEINAIYRKWFESPIPPQQINLKLPMSYLLRDSFKAPTDWVPK